MESRGYAGHGRAALRTEADRGVWSALGLAGEAPWALALSRGAARSPQPPRCGHSSVHGRPNSRQAGASSTDQSPGLKRPQLRGSAREHCGPSPHRPPERRPVRTPKSRGRPGREQRLWGQGEATAGPAPWIPTAPVSPLHGLPQERPVCCLARGSAVWCLVSFRSESDLGVDGSGAAPAEGGGLPAFPQRTPNPGQALARLLPGAPRPRPG